MAITEIIDNLIRMNRNDLKMAGMSIQAIFIIGMLLIIAGIWYVFFQSLIVGLFMLLCGLYIIYSVESAIRLKKKR